MSNMAIRWDEPNETKPVELVFNYGVTEQAVKAMAEGLKSAGYRHVEVLREKRTWESI